MSKRYGRNQKRKHRETIKNLEEALYMERGLCKYANDRRKAVEEKMMEVIDIVESMCANSVALDPKTMLGSMNTDRIRLPVVGPIPYLTPSTAIRVVTDSFDTIDLYTLRTVVEERRDVLSTCVHLMYSSPNGGESYYMISEKALMAMPEDVLSKKIVPYIARELIRHLRGGMRNDGRVRSPGRVG